LRTAASANTLANSVIPPHFSRARLDKIHRIRPHQAFEFDQGGHVLSSRERNLASAA
jgi:hypothetical protein